MNVQQENKAAVAVLRDANATAVADALGAWEPAPRVRIKIDLSVDLRSPADSIPFAGQEVLDALRSALAKAIWELLPKDRRNPSETQLRISLDRRTLS